ncbi:MAG TPA: uroporphyrinogen-III C-methyltransferase [Thermoanaerobaculia bacterium]|nr:uroporphyrinogen-III C-methyltransferase [Thermoanaerobaculia bacterium]
MIAEAIRLGRIGPVDPEPRGHVWLVGAGPGDPELITVRGLRCLRRSEVLLYDRLVSPELLEEAPRTALRIDVGKAPGRHARKQEEICRLLIAHARAGRRVVRLKGGDPFVFGRGGEEALACAEAGVPFEIVPGISSAIAAPSAAGIPITHRGVAGSVAIVAGHCIPGSPEPGDRIERIDWPAVARLDTIVILMGLGRLPEITAALIAAGRSWETPAAAIASATLSTQQTVVGTLATLERLVAEAGLEAPATLVVGEVVQVGEKIAEACYAWEDEVLAVA